MAHFAQLDANNFVTNVIVVNNEELLENGIEIEQKGIEFCQNLFGGRWVQTSYNGSFRKTFASIGSKYDEEKDAFIPPVLKYNDLIFNLETCEWEKQG